MIRNFSRSEIESLKASFQKSSPFRHVVVSRSLINYRPLLAGIKSETLQRKNSDLFSFSQSIDLVYARSASVRKAVKYFRSDEFAGLVTEVTGINVSPGAADISASLYQSTDYLLCHDDELEGRKVAFIVYLSSMQRSDGGSLMLYSDRNGHPNEAITRLFPTANELLLFEVSRKSWHEVQEVLSNKSRYSIGGWLH